MKKIFSNSFIFTTAAAAIALLGQSVTAQAISFSITDRNPSNPGAVETALDALEDSVNGTFSATMLDDFLGSMANAARGSYAGLGTDGPVRGDLFSISTGGGLALAAQSDFSLKIRQNELPGIGIAGQPVVTIGFNAKRLPRAATLGLDPTKVDYFVNFMSIDLSDVSPTAGFSMSSFGIMGRYWLKDAKSALWAFRWDGLSVTTGLQYSALTASVNGDLNFSSGSGLDAVNWAPDARFSIKTSAITIPVDLQTGISLLKFWSIYGGTGLRFNFGSAQTVGDISGNITNGLAGTVGVGTLDLASEGQKPAIVSQRFMLGTQLNFGPAKLSFEAGFATPKVGDLALNFRFVW
jgi:hypothetical protein